MRLMKDSGVQLPLPRIIESAYGLYPGIADFSFDYDADDYYDWVEQSNGDPLPAPLAIYVADCANRHSPFGGLHDTPETIIEEVKLQGALFDSDRPVKQLICTGNIANAWPDEQLYQLVSAIQDAFTLEHATGGWCACLGSTSIESARMRQLQVLGFVNMRFVVCPERRGENMLSTVADVFEVASRARVEGMRQIMIDLFLDDRPVPHQDLRLLLDEVRPDILRLVGSVDVTAADAIGPHPVAQFLADRDYTNIGLDWFVRSGASWCTDLTPQRLHWSMLGYTDMSGPDVVGIGPGAVSTVGDFYARSEYRPDHYRRLVGRQLIPTVCGLELESDDRLRREVIALLLTDSAVDIRAVENKWGISFPEFFSLEMNELRNLQAASWLRVGSHRIELLTRERSRCVQACEVFARRTRLPDTQATPHIA